MGTESSSSESKDPVPPPVFVDDVIRRLYAYAYRLCGSHDQAEELVQQTFLVAEERKHQLRDADKFVPWLMRVLRNAFLQDRRRRRPASASQLELDLEQVEGSGAVGQIQSSELQDVLQRLPEDQRRVLMMFYFESWTYREIAEQLDIPIGTVMSRLSRSKRQLKQLLMAEQLERIGQGWESI